MNRKSVYQWMAETLFNKRNIYIYILLYTPYHESCIHTTHNMRIMRYSSISPVGMLQLAVKSIDSSARHVSRTTSARSSQQPSPGNDSRLSLEKVNNPFPKRCFVGKSFHDFEAFKHQFWDILGNLKGILGNLRGIALL